MDNIFLNCKTYDEGKELYRKLCFSLHPDKGGDRKAFEVMINDWNEAKVFLPGSAIGLKEESDPFKALVLYSPSEQTSSVITGPTELNLDLTNQVLGLIQGLDCKLELIGSWLWLTGEKDQIIPIKESLKALGFRFSASKKAWYFTESKRKSFKGYRSRYSNLNEIKNNYSSNSIY